MAEVRAEAKAKAAAQVKAAAQAGARAMEAGTEEVEQQVMVGGESAMAHSAAK